MTKEEAFERVAASFIYDPETGLFTHGARARELFDSERSWHHFLSKHAGKVAGNRHHDGYWRLRVNKHTIMAHRAAWFLVNGEWPDGEIDHINGDPSDNRLSNLRVVTASQNRMNQCRRSDNRSGVTGVCFRRDQKRWIAQICVGGKRRQIGCFLNRDDAIRARLAWQQALPFGPNHGASA